MASLYQSTGTLRRHPRGDEDVDPMSSVANISDAMLVFACGLLISLVLMYNVDLTQFTQVELDEEQQIESMESLREMLENGGDAYIQRGTVYQDPRTGELYMLEETDAQGNPLAGSTASGQTSSQTSESASNATSEQVSDTQDSQTRDVQESQTSEAQDGQPE